MSVAEIERLSRAISARWMTAGNYTEIAAGADVKQPVVSLALHRRLALRTDPVDRLFEYLGVPLDAPEGVDEPIVAKQPVDQSRPEHRLAGLMNLMTSLSDGSDAADRRLASLLQAIGRFTAGSDATDASA